MGGSGRIPVPNWTSGGCAQPPRSLPLCHCYENLSGTFCWRMKCTCIAAKLPQRPEPRPPPLIGGQPHSLAAGPPLSVSEHHQGHQVPLADPKVTPHTWEKDATEPACVLGSCHTAFMWSSITKSTFILFCITSKLVIFTFICSILPPH